jgi:hypothetical protein
MRKRARESARTHTHVDIGRPGVWLGPGCEFWVVGIGIVKISIQGLAVEVHGSGYASYPLSAAMHPFVIGRSKRKI